MTKSNLTGRNLSVHWVYIYNAEILTELFKELERNQTSGCDIDDDGDKECWSICYSNECNGDLPTDGDLPSDDGSDAQALKLSFVFVIFSLIFN